MKLPFEKKEPVSIMALVFALFFLVPILLQSQVRPMRIDHTCTDITKIPESAILAAKQGLHIAYGHTSHGSQLTDGMSALVAFMNGKGYPTNLYDWNNGGSGGALDLHDYAMGGDVGYYPDWVNNTHTYLGAVNPATGRGVTNPDVNVIIWSWCGQVSGLTEQQMITNYLAPMTALETEYWGVTFVYMTGHLDGSGANGNLNLRNDQIRLYCQQNNKILYDFADIESYDPDGLVNYMPMRATDNCDYDGDNNGSTESNWAIAWQNTHTLNVDWFNCSAAHTQPLNGNRKAYAAWWLWARLAGWNGNSPGPAVQLVSLVPGWNWVSFNVLPADRSLNSVFGGILSQVQQVKTQTQSVMYSGNQTWVGDLANMEGIQAGMMYKIRVTAACMLTITGTRLATNTPVQLVSGWNWVAYFPQAAMPIGQALSSITNQVQQGKSQTQSAIYSSGQWLGDLTQLEQGQGYTIRMSSPGVLAYPSMSLQSR